MDTIAEQDAKINTIVETLLVPFGSFQTRVTHQPLEEDAIEPWRQPGWVPYVFPIGTGDVEGPVTNSTVAN